MNQRLAMRSFKDEVERIYSQELAGLYAEDAVRQDRGGAKETRAV